MIGGGIDALLWSPKDGMIGSSRMGNVAGCCSRHMAIDTGIINRRPLAHIEFAGVYIDLMTGRAFLLVELDTLRFGRFSMRVMTRRT